MRNKRLDELEGLEELSARLADERAHALANFAVPRRTWEIARRAASAALGEGAEAGLRRLAMPRARFEVKVGGRRDKAKPSTKARAEKPTTCASSPARTSRFLLAANPGRAADAAVQGGFWG